MRTANTSGVFNGLLYYAGRGCKDRAEGWAATVKLLKANVPTS